MDYAKYLFERSLARSRHRNTLANNFDGICKLFVLLELKPVDLLQMRSLEALVSSKRIGQHLFFFVLLETTNNNKILWPIVFV